jgi:hypothetical protein
MPPRDVFDFPVLPPELQEMIYEQLYGSIDMSPLNLLFRTGPELSIRTTCRSIYNEAARFYRPAHTRFRRARLMLLEEMWAEVGEMLDERDHPREQSLWYTMTALTRGAHFNYSYQFDTCRHRCKKFDSYYCNCIEHNTCINCGRWLALAVYYDMHPELEVPRLYHPDGRPTVLGQKVATHTQQAQVDTDFLMSKNNTHRYPPDCPELFGETWWRFEYFRQRYRIISVSARYHMSRGTSLPRKRMANWARWDRILERNGLQSEGWKADIEARGLPSWFERFLIAFGADSMRMVLIQFWSTH